MKHIYCLGFFVILFLICGCHSKKGTREEVIWLYEQGKKWEEASQADSAAAYYLRSYKLAKELKEDSLIGKIGNTLGDIFNVQNLFHHAISIHQEAFKYNNKFKDKTAASYSLRGIGKDYMFNVSEDSILFRKRLDSALVYFKKAEKLISQIKSQEEVSLIYNNLCVYYTEVGKFSTALNYNQRAILVAEDSTTIYRNFSCRGGLYYSLMQYDSAIYYNKKALKSSNLYTKYAACYQLANTFVSMGSPDSAIYTKIAYDIHDKIETQKHEEAVMLVLQRATQERIERERSFIFWGIILSIFLFIIIVILLFVRHTRYKKVTRLERNSIIRQKENLDKRLSTLEEKLQSKDFEQKKIEQDFMKKEKECVDLQRIKENMIQQKKELSKRLFLLEEKLLCRDFEQKKIEQEFLEKEKECAELQKIKKDIIQQKENLNERLCSLEAKLQNKDYEHKKATKELHRKEKECAELQKLNEEVLAYNMAEMQLLELIVQKESLGKEKIGLSYEYYQQQSAHSYLKSQDQSDFFELIRESFSEYIQILESRFELKERETIICCLIQLGFNKQECANCIKASLGAYYTIISRLKNKIELKFSLKEEISLLLLKEKG